MEIPKLPGLVPSRNHPSPRKKGLQLVSGVRLDSSVTELSPRIIGNGAQPDKDRFLSTYQSTSSPKNVAAQPASPVRNAPFLKYDKQVLRFYGYFEEAVPESPQEEFRIRRVVILYYLEDDTIEIQETKSRDSGMPQGKFLKRMTLQKPTEEGQTSASWTWNDLSVATNLVIYGRSFRVYDADEFTRNFYAEKGITLAPSEDAPSDGYTKRREKVMARSGRDVSTNPINRQIKQYVEAEMGNSAQSQNASAKQFLQNAGKVLSFEAEYDTRHMVGGELIHYTVNHYLADGCFEIKENYGPNSGKNPYPLMLKKQKLKRDQSNFVRMPGGLDPSEATKDKNETYLGPQDLRVGAFLSLYNRPLKLVDADQFTRRYYREELNVELEPAMYSSFEEHALPKPAPPPHNGIGSEEDSLGNCYSLIPKQPKKDARKARDFEGKVLRFSAQLQSTRPENKGRNFIVAFYPADDTLGVYEPEVRNSGFVGGKFLERGRYKATDGRFFSADMLNVGSTVVIMGHKFDLIDADTFTKQFLQK